jgi:hypothetical protein
MKSGSILTRLATTLVFCVTLVSPVAAFHVGFNYYCYATQSDGIPITDYDTLTGESYVGGDYTKTGGPGNFGTARFYADLSTATVSAFAHSHGVQTGPNTFSSGTGRVEKIEFQDRLIFTVPAGYYPAGVQVSLLGRVMGTISSDIGAGASARCYVLLGTGIFEISLLEVGVDESGTIGVDEVFTVTEELVAPGSTLNESRDADSRDSGSAGGELDIRVRGLSVFAEPRSRRPGRRARSATVRELSQSLQSDDNDKLLSAGARHGQAEHL